VEIQRQVRGENSGQPGLFETYLIEALIQQGKNSEAERRIRESLKASPTDFDAVMKLIDVLRAQSKNAEADQATGEFMATLRKDPDPAGRIGKSGWNAGNFATSLRARGELADAAWLYRQSIDGYRRQKGDLWNTAKMFGYLIDTLQEQGKVDDARATLRESLPAYAAAVDDQRKREGETARFAWILSSYAERLYADRQFAEAEKLCREALAIRRARQGEEDGETSAALGSVEAVLLAQGKVSEANALWRERLAYWQGQLATADTSERRSHIHLRMFASLKKLGHFEQAKESCRQALAFNPKEASSFQAIYHIAWELASPSDPAQRDLALAEALYRQSLVIKRKLDGDETSDMFILLDGLAGVLQAQGKNSETEFEALWRERLALWQKELDNPATPPERRTLIYLIRARLLMYCGQLEQVRQSSRMALASNPASAHAVALNNLSWALSTAINPACRDPALAVALAEKAVALAPTEGGHRNTLGVARYETCDDRGAVADLEKSVELRNGGDSFDFFFLAMAHERLGDPQAARQWYDKGVQWMDQRSPQHEELRRFRSEAAELLRLPAASGSRPSTSPSTRPEAVAIPATAATTRPR
jgi:tetratricopeptide (TPR) repeat protein